MSWAQNGEDVVLWRALHDVEDGCYVDVGAHHPSVLSVTRALYEKGWSGVNLEPLPDAVALMEQARPRDLTLRAAAGSSPGRLTFHEVVGTGLSTLRDDVAATHEGSGFEVREHEVEVVTLDDVLDEHLAGRQVHVLKVDVEGAEADVLLGLDLERHRPWVLLVEATEPMTVNPSHAEWEPRLLERGYDFCLFDGISRFYVASEHAERLRYSLSYPACALDDYIPSAQHEAETERDAAAERADAWRAEALRQAVRYGPQLEELGNLRAGFGPLAARVAALEWHEGLLLEERTWLRGLLADEKARPTSVTVAAPRELLRAAARSGVRRAQGVPSPAVQLPLRVALGVRRRLAERRQSQETPQTEQAQQTEQEVTS